MTKIQNIASVIVLLDCSNNTIVLTKRSLNLKRHAGEICFPGGYQDPGDRDLWHTALRELYEELGITSERVHLMHALDPVMTIRRTKIHPWFAQIQSLKPYHPNPHEVSELIVLPLAQVSQERHYEIFTVKRLGVSFKTYRYTAFEQCIWGATAKILKQLTHIKPFCSCYD